MEIAKDSGDFFQKNLASQLVSPNLQTQQLVILCVRPLSILRHQEQAEQYNQNLSKKTREENCFAKASISYFDN